MVVLQNSLGIMNYSEKSKGFYERWTSDEKFEYINKTMRSIRKVQNSCELLRICVEENMEKKKIYQGFIFDKMERNDGSINSGSISSINCICFFTKIYCRRINRWSCKKLEIL